MSTKNRTRVNRFEFRANDDEAAKLPSIRKAPAIGAC